MLTLADYQVQATEISHKHWCFEHAQPGRVHIHITVIGPHGVNGDGVHVPAECECQPEGDEPE